MKYFLLTMAIVALMLSSCAKSADAQSPCNGCESVVDPVAVDSCQCQMMQCCKRTPVRTAVSGVKTHLNGIACKSSARRACRKAKRCCSK